ncbi:hypothetical protein CC86DRAFT_399383 [Ophiobolus disseminans]|uniref:Uncharacterized protein n=1 Tax=Ophiobolus disseminans TaxID=1469910 RepID=A0A6A6ZCV6_9PLEO|nr:hypothetical protein CC86DRAFT_399383 [Ophiobolus disseminans]
MPESSPSENRQRRAKRRRHSPIIDLTKSSPESETFDQTDASHEPIAPPPRTSALGVHAALTELTKVSQQLEEEDNHRSDLQDKYNSLMKDFKKAKATLDAVRVALVDQAIDTSAGHCNNCATKFDFSNALESPHILVGCGAGIQSAELA